MFLFFLMGVKTNPTMMLQPGRIPVVIGTAVSLLTLGLTTSLSLLLKAYVPMDKSLAGSLPLIAASQCLASEVLGQHFIFGPLLLGLAVPEGPPLGSALVAKLDLFITGLLYPAFLTVSGLKTNFFEITLQSTGIVMIIVIFATLLKIGVVLVIAHYTEMPFREALVLGLLLNARGICELLILNLWKDGQILSNQEFSLAVIAVVAVTAIVTPMIRALYDPSRHQFPTRRRTIQQAKEGAELRVLVCIHNQDNVPTVVNLLEASYATEESPIAVIALLLVELVGRVAPMLIAHQPFETLEINASTSRSSHIINALHQYRVYNEGRATVQSFSAISHMEMMHEDICRVAFEQNATLVVIPFHKHWAIDGEIESVERAIQHMNTKVLEKAPCAVGILIDRGILKGSLSILNNQSMYHVVVLYIGGPDDVESLSYGARMANHTNVTLTIIRFLLFGSNNARDRKLDNDFINEVCHANTGNEDFSYQEQVGLGAWTECPELGVIGDFIASSDFDSSASVLVVQHHRVLGGRLMSRAMKPIINDRDVPLQSMQNHAVAETTSHDSGPAWAISMDRE
ncbi:hypothetical protein Vadar_030182 [Vaccinium darrowii]|uniref:Uncharacterized protein n=1 Tax=Vaccinium darrowii TaxID=229202 RepID=A0ACB7YQH7_9ERIC|nr:hypothetical protein Vadar_030182 [Vaccinium darrowii]